MLKKSNKKNDVVRNKRSLISLILSYIKKENGEMGDASIVPLMIFFCITITIFPLTVVSSQVAASREAAAEEVMAKFVNDVATSGDITEEDYAALEQQLATLGYQCEISAQVLDSNPDIKTTQANNATSGNPMYVFLGNYQLQADFLNNPEAGNRFTFTQGSVFNLSAYEMKGGVIRSLFKSIYSSSDEQQKTISKSQTITKNGSQK